jgi:hypothetical protein
MPVPETQFSKDVLGRYVCNSLGEAVASGPFDVVIVGGGTFGLALAQDLFFRSKTTGTGVVEDSLRPGGFRVLVLEAGPFVLDEHTQDVPGLRLFPPSALPQLPACPLPTTRQQLVAQGRQFETFLEVWGLPFDSNEPFGGLAYCVGGRSLFFGGWSPQYLDTEMPVQPGGAITDQTLWPEQVVQDLKVRFFTEGAEATGAITSNDYINGAMHAFFRDALHQSYAQVPNAVQLAELPDYSSFAGPAARLALGPNPTPAQIEALKLDAPLAVQIETRPGYFPFNKFSSVPLGVAAARDAAAESGGNDASKRLMIVPNCHVKRLVTGTYTLASGATVQEIIGIDTSSGPLDLTATIAGNSNRRPAVVLAAGTVESARIALLSVPGARNAAQIGRNFMVHLRKNVGFRIPIPAALTIKDVEVSALVVRCRTSVNGSPVHFHLQITAASVQASAANQADSQLFQKVPDLDNIQRLEDTPINEIDVFVRVVGEMLPPFDRNTVTVPLQPADPDEYTIPRASVQITSGPEDQALQQKIDETTAWVAANVFGQPNLPNIVLDGIGTSFHESGTLRMGNDPARSVVNADGQFHDVPNLYAGDASVLPTCGSANPAMNGIALRRRLATRLMVEGDGIGSATSGRAVRPFFQPPMPAAPPVVGTVIPLFDGATLAGWRMAGRGAFQVVDGALQSLPSFDLGLLWSTVPMPANYRLELEFLMRGADTNSGVFIQFRHPDAAGYYNPAWSPVDTGFEIQIDNSGTAPAGQPQGLAKHRTGAVYNVNYPGDPNPTPGVPPATPGDFVNPQDASVGVWNAYRIEVQADVITVNLNGTDTAKYTNPDPNRGQFSATEPTYVGLESYANRSYTAAFRNIQITAL